MATDADKLNIDSILQRLLEGKAQHNSPHHIPCDVSRFLNAYSSFLVRGGRPGKNIQLSEAEVRGLCLKSRDIFLSQPVLLELEAPIKICGESSQDSRVQMHVVMIS